MIAYTRERRTRCRAMLKRGWGRVPLLLSMGNAGVRARTKRITACMPRRAPTWTRRNERGKTTWRRKRGNGRTIVPTSERANQRRSRETARGVHRVAVKREQPTPRENQRPIVVIATLPSLPSLVPSPVPSCVHTRNTQHAHTGHGTHACRPARSLAGCLRGSRTRARARARARRHLDSPYPLRTRQLEPRGSARCTRPYVKDEVVLDCRRGSRERKRERERRERSPDARDYERAALPVRPSRRNRPARAKGCENVPRQ